MEGRIEVLSHLYFGNMGLVILQVKPLFQNRDMTVPLERFWAKLGNGDASYHPLVAHSADVAAVFRALLEPPGVFAVRLAGAAGLRELRSSDRAALVYLAVLHDLGKANHGFQEKRYPCKQRRRWAAYDHLDAVYGSLRDSTPLRRLLGELASAVHPDPEIGADLMAATIYHHGRPGPLRTDRVLTESKKLWEQDAQTGRDPLAHIRHLAVHARRWSGLDELPNEPEPLPITPAFTHLYAGLLTLADWIGSNEQIFKFTPEADNEPDRYWTERAFPLAREACAQIGLVPRTQPVSLSGLPLLKALFPATFRDAGHPPTDLQTRIATLPLPGPGARLLIESETGSGKTESALALYARIRAERNVTGLMFALPTRATASAMYNRVLAALPGLYPDGVRPTVALAIGGEGPRTEATAAVEQTLPANPQTWDEEIGPELQVLRNWASERSKTFLAAEIVVGTLDQALLAALRVKHAHLRLAPLSRHLLVVDELHSYDRYMATALARLLALHTQAGGIALFMSATLSDAERRRFGGATEPEPTLTQATERPYPLLSICNAPNAPWCELKIEASNAAGQVTTKRIRWQCEADEAAALGQAIRAARAGARVCVLRNTVSGARRTVRQVHDAGAADVLWMPGAHLFTPAYHSRYTLPDRKALDQAVLDVFGKGAPVGRGVLLVATQVAEQSLDVDFDLLITDLCPVDVLLQRIGRLHRHQRDGRPAGYTEPHALVLVPAGGLEPLLRAKIKPNGWGTVYPDLCDLELTSRLIDAEPEIEIPRQNRYLVEQVYHPERQEILAYAWQQHREEQAAKDCAHQTHAHGVCVDFDETYSQNRGNYYLSKEALIRTRLGDDQIRVALPAPLPGCYDDRGTVGYVDLPEREIVRAGVDFVAPRAEGGEREGDRVRFTLGELAFAYGPDGWEWGGAADLPTSNP